MIYPTPYETIAGKGYVTKNIINGIQRGLITGEVRTEGALAIVESGTEISPFNHPLVVPHENKKYIAIDVRTMVSSTNGYDIRISNKAA